MFIFKFAGYELRSVEKNYSHIAASVAEPQWHGLLFSFQAAAG